MAHLLTTFSRGFDPGEIIACDPVALVTQAIPIAKGQGWLPRGTLLDWTRDVAAPATKSGAVGNNTFGVLSQGLNTDMEEDTGAAVYLSGAFILPRIRAANSGVTIDGPAMERLRAKSIFLENAAY